MFENTIFEIAESINQILVAALVVMVLSYLIRAASFNIKERIIRSYIYLLLTLLVMYSGEILILLNVSEEMNLIWQAIQWVGVIFFPATFINFSDAILATTGLPSKGKRTFLIQISTFTSIIFFIFIPLNTFLSNWLSFSKDIEALNQAFTYFLFSIYYFIILSLAFTVMIRAINQTKIKSSKRRLRYLITGAMTIAIGSFPYISFTGGIAGTHPVWFVSIAMVGNILILMALVLLGYAITFFGVDWPDRIVKQRLIKWLLRGPVSAIIILALLAIYNSTLKDIIPYSDFTLMAMIVLSVVIIQHSITFLAPKIEKKFFTQVDENSYIALKSLEERLVTHEDFLQFAESILSALCNRLDTETAFIAILNQNQIESYISVGDSINNLDQLSAKVQAIEIDSSTEGFHVFNHYCFSFLENKNSQKIGLMGFLQPEDFDIEYLDEEDYELIERFQERAALLLENRINQQELLAEVAEISPDINYIQRLQAAARYDTKDILNIEMNDSQLDAKTINKYLKDALKHYWGGPNLSESPLVNMNIVQEELEKSDHNETTALRNIINIAIEKIKPAGERKYTGEWLLYNILDLKYLQGMKGRDITRRLAMSEADFYRKQKIAINEIANVMLEMEKSTQE